MVAGRLAPNSPRILAAFDFDGTLTDVDTLRLFLWRCAGPRRFSWAFLRSIRSLARGWKQGGPERDHAKEALFSKLCAGRPDAELKLMSAELARTIVERHLRMKIASQLRKHVAAGHAVAVVSASFDAYVTPVATQLGASIVFATRWQVSTDGRLTGLLDGPNVRGPRKAELLSEWRSSHEVDRVFAYGDSAGDEEMLALADVPVWVRKTTVLPEF
jgi:phosphatidylglycerophosphatase C